MSIRLPFAASMLQQCAAEGKFFRALSLPAASRWYPLPPMDKERREDSRGRRVWVFKVNTQRGWEFDEYFRSRTRGLYELGDEGWIRSASSLKFLREDVKRGDIFLCYEADRKRVVGLARAASDGRDVGLGSLLDFCPPREAVRLKNPLTRRPDLDHILAFSPHRGRGTVQRIEPDEWIRLRRILFRKNPEQAPALRRLLGS